MAKLIVIVIENYNRYRKLNIRKHKQQLIRLFTSIFNVFLQHSDLNLNLVIAFYFIIFGMHCAAANLANKKS